MIFVSGLVKKPSDSLACDPLVKVDTKGKTKIKGEKLVGSVGEFRTTFRTRVSQA